MSASGGKADMACCGNPLSRSLLGVKRTWTIYFAPTQPQGVSRGNWIQTMPGKGYFPMLRLYSPLEAFFAKTWRPSEIELVR